MAITLDSDKTSVYWMRDVPHKNFVRRTTPPLSVSSSSDGIMIDHILSSTARTRRQLQLVALLN